MPTLQELLLSQAANTKTNYQPLIDANAQAAQLSAQGAVNAGNIGQNYLNQALGAVTQGANTATQTRDPYTSAGQSTISSLMDYLGLSGQSSDQMLAKLQQTPGYQFTLQSALDAIDRGAASKGKLYSSQTMQAYQDRASQLANQTYQNNVNNLSSFLQQTAPFAQQQAAADYTTGTDKGAILSQLGDTLGNAELARSGALAQGLLGGASAQVAQSSANGQNLSMSNLTPEVNAGGSVSPWGNTLSSGTTSSPQGGVLGSSGGGGGSTGGTTTTPTTSTTGTATTATGTTTGGTAATTPTTGTTGTNDNQALVDLLNQQAQQEYAASQMGAGGTMLPTQQQNPQAIVGAIVTGGDFLGMANNYINSLNPELSTSKMQAMSLYNDAYEEYRALVTQYQAAAVGSPEKQALDSRVSQVGQDLNKLQYSLYQKGLWGN